MKGDRDKAILFLNAVRDQLAEISKGMEVAPAGVTPADFIPVIAVAQVTATVGLAWATMAGDLD